VVDLCNNCARRGARVDSLTFRRRDRASVCWLAVDGQQLVVILEQIKIPENRASEINFYDSVRSEFLEIAKCSSSQAVFDGSFEKKTVFVTRIFF
jgi:deoxycytidine triphosphate deaminase